MLRKRTGWHRPFSSHRAIVGGVKVESKVDPDPALIPHEPFSTTPPELMGHLRWMAQKHSLNQDIFLAGHPGPLKRRLVASFANICNLEMEFVSISRDTTESDIKQRREIEGSSVLFHDQPPVRAAINGRLLVLDGIEYAERNVLPTLNNLLENREMSLEDGRFLTNDNIAGEYASVAGSKIVRVHPNFRVVAMGQCVPPYSGRTMDPPLRSRFQSRFIDEVKAETLLSLFGEEISHVDGKKVRELVAFYESLRVVRGTLIRDGGAGVMTGVPTFSLDEFAHCLSLLRTFPKMSAHEAVVRCVPTGSWMRDALPPRLTPSLTRAFENLQPHISNTSSSYQSTTPSSYDLKEVAMPKPGAATLRSSITTSTSISISIPHADILSTAGPTLKATAIFAPRAESKSLFGGAGGDDVAVLVPCGPQSISHPPHKSLHSSHGRGESALVDLLPTQSQVFAQMMMDHACDKHICLLGPKGSGKSHVARAFGAALGYKVRTFPLYQELTARDLLQRRVTQSSDEDANISTIISTSGSSGGANAQAQALSGDHGTREGLTGASTSWVDSPLVAAARSGDLCVLDGVDRVDPQCLFALRTLLQDGVIDLPNGQRLSRHSSDPARAIHPSFRVLALGLPPNASRPEDARERWVSSDLGFVLHYLPAAPTEEVLKVLHRGRDSSTLTVEDEILSRAISALRKSAVDHPELDLSLRQVLRLKRLLCGPSTASVPPASQHHGVGTESSRALDEVKQSLERMLMIKFLPKLSEMKFLEALALDKYNVASSSSSSSSSGQGNGSKQGLVDIAYEDEGRVLRIGDVRALVRTSERPEKIPRPLFHENSLHTQMLRELLHAYAAGDTSLLLIGNQGVGKNKLVDRLLQLLNAEREYIQLHRDTTIQSLTLLPLLERGRIVYEDSPMVRAAREGRVLVVDEADKAPLEVVCLLKALAEDGEVVLYDGRRLLSKSRLVTEGGDPSNPPQGIILIHDDFKLIVLANRPGFPFLGNNFFRECGDVFSTHVVDNLDIASEVALLRAYAPNVDTSILLKIAGAFSDLREAHNRGDMNYPFSAREAVAVVKHFAAFSSDGIAAAVEDILAFDALSPVLRAQIAAVFQAHGLPVPLEASSSVASKPPVELTRWKAIDPPTQHRINISIGATATCPTTVRPTKVSDWTSVTTVTAPYSISSSRLLRFDEEIGRLAVGAIGGGTAPGRAFNGELLGMVATTSSGGALRGENKGEGEGESAPGVEPIGVRPAAGGDDGGSLHVLTMHPLTLHSFAHTATAVDILRGRVGAETSCQKYTKREMLNDESSWRLGPIDPVLVPLGKWSGGPSGAAVIIPDLSLAMVTSADPSAPVLTVTLPIKSAQADSNQGMLMNLFGKQGKGKGKGGTSGPKMGKVQAVSSCHVDGGSAVALFRPGARELFVVDFETHRLQHVDLGAALPVAQQGLRSVAPVRRGEWNVGVEISEEAGEHPPAIYVLKVHENVSTLTQMNASAESSMVSNSNSALSTAWADLASVPRSATAHTTATTTLAGSEAAFGGSVAFENDATQLVSSWSRVAVTGPSVGVPKQAAANGIVANVVIPSGVKKGDESVQLELVNLEDHQIKHLSVARPQISARDTVASVDFVRRGRPRPKDGHPNPPPASTKAHEVAAGAARAEIVSSNPLQHHSHQLDDSVVAVCHPDGTIRFFEIDDESIEASQRVWEKLMGTANDPATWTIDRGGGGGGGPRRGADQKGDPRTGLGAPKHGKEDEKNEPHVGGNTWAGGTGGSDTAGLGGRGGPYRLDKGHTVHQISDEMKKEISAMGREKAEQMAKEALAKRLEDIAMGRSDFEVYMSYRGRVEAQIAQLRSTLDELARRSRERVWLRHQAQGDLDDSKLVDGLAGDRLVFKRRGVPDTPHGRQESSVDGKGKKLLQFVVDVSGSMYRFNGQDRRLERMLESMLLVMEAMPGAAGTGDGGGSAAGNIQYCITGHSGTSDNINFIGFDEEKPSNESERLTVLASMAAHAQYTLSGDNTLGAVRGAIKNVVSKSEGDVQAERFVFVISDANFDRYGISPRYLAELMTKEPRVQVHFILIASLDDEAGRIAKALPTGRVHLCFESTDLPSVFRSILTSTGGALDV